MKTPYGEISDSIIPDTAFNRKAMRAPELKSCKDFNDINNLINRELAFFQFAGQPEFEGYAGPGRYHHCKILCDAIWRSIPGEEQFVWHPWLEDQLREFCQTDRVVITGPSSGGKSMGAAIFCNLFWMCSPDNTGALVCSTTRDGLERRIWGFIWNLHVAAKRLRGPLGNLVNSDLAIETTKGDKKHGIFGITVAKGDEQKALGRIIGFHPRRIFVGVDELTDVSWAIIEALTNLFTGKQKAKFVGIGNAASIFDSHGKMAEPKDGWGSVTVESNRWETKRGGICLHFDGMKCENVIKGEKIFDFLLTLENIEETKRDYGIDSAHMWRFNRGFWCPEGVVRSVLTESLIQKSRAMEKAQWRGDYTEGAALDPAFEGGDRCILRKLRWGQAEAGLETLELGEIFPVKIQVNSKEPVHYQIARQVREKCREWGVEVQNFALDSTGEGGGLASIIATEWAPGFVQVEFGGKASELPVSKINQKRCCDEYYNRVTELWHFVRTLVMNGQLRGLDSETAIEFCTRIFTVENKIRLESKIDLKKRMNGRSPDLSDCVAVGAELVRQRAGFGLQQTIINRSLEREWQKLVEEFQVDEDDSFTFEAIENL